MLTNKIGEGLRTQWSPVLRRLVSVGAEKRVEKKKEKTARKGKREEEKPRKKTRQYIQGKRLKQAPVPHLGLLSQLVM